MRQCLDCRKVRAEFRIFSGGELFAALPAGHCGDDRLGHGLVLSIWHVLVLAMPAVDIAVLVMIRPAHFIFRDYPSAIGTKRVQCVDVVVRNVYAEQFPGFHAKGNPLADVALRLYD